MKRAIVQPADVSGAPLNELKQWLGITRDVQDSELVGLLQASLDLCEAFTGQIPLEAVCEETLPAKSQWACLLAKPVRAITSVDAIGADNARLTLASTGYEIEIDSTAIGAMRLTAGIEHDLVVVTFVAGLADSWSNLPAALRHGIIRMAAHHYISRDKGDSNAPPAAVTALWRPWKQVRL